MNFARIKKTIAGIVFSFLLLVILFIVVEFFIRVLYKDETVLFPRYHTDAQYGEYTLRKIRPNSEFWHTSVDGKWKFETNKQGFRNYKDFAYHKPKGVMRIISLGDSHTQGYEVRQEFTFSAAMEKYLNNHSFNVEVINAGVSGFSTAEELLFLENEGIKYKPDFVVLGFYANDFQDNIKANLFRLDENGNLKLHKKEHIPGVKIQNVIYSFPPVRWLSENSYFYSLLFNNTWQFFKTRLSKNASDRVVEYAIPTQDNFTDSQEALTFALLKRMYAFCQENDIKLVILDIPRRTEENVVMDSISEPLSRAIRNYSDVYISSELALSDYIGVAEIHRPHGHKHISEFTHTILGVNAAKEIISLSQ